MAGGEVVARRGGRACREREREREGERARAREREERERERERETGRERVRAASTCVDVVQSVADIDAHAPTRGRDKRATHAGGKVKVGALLEARMEVGARVDRLRRPGSTSV